MPKILEYGQKLLLCREANDKLIRKYANKGKTKLYFSSQHNLNVAEKFFDLNNTMSNADKFSYLFENLSTNAYSDYPVYLFIYGEQMRFKKYLIHSIVNREQEVLVNILNQKLLQYMKKYKGLDVIITFDNFHTIKINVEGIKTIYKSNFEVLYGLKSEALWINLSVDDNIRFLDFSRIQFHGFIYDPFMNWKLSFLNHYGFIIV